MSEYQSNRPRRAPSPSPQPNGKVSEQSTLNEGKAGHLVPLEKPRLDGKVELTEQQGYEHLGFSWSSAKKWRVLVVIFLVQCSMNFNAAFYSSAVPAISEHYAVSEQAARVGQMIFLVAYGFGCELWASPSEELGRWPILQASLLLVNIFQLPAALSKNFGTIIVARFLGGLSSAGGSVTLGMVADMWQPDEQQYAVAFVVLSSVGGPLIAPIIGGFVAVSLDWRWNFWLQLIFGATTQIIHFLLVPETRVTVLLDREAKRRRKTGEDLNCYGPNELKEHRFAFKEVITIMSRPFVMFAREPIVLFLSLLSGFSDALIFIFLEAYGLVLDQWGFSTQLKGLGFLALVVAYIGTYFLHIPDIKRQNEQRRREPNTRPEERMRILMWIVPLEAIGLMGFAWSSLGPEYHVHWIAPMIFTACIGVANFSIYFCTIDYMTAAYGPYAASACGGNGFARDVLAGVSAMYATPFYHNIGTRWHLVWPSFILSFIAVLVAIPVYIFYFHGEYFRERSHFAQTIAAERQLNNEYRPEKSKRREVGATVQHVERV